jgi:hypothetical protein
MQSEESLVTVAMRHSGLYTVSKYEWHLTDPGNTSVALRELGIRKSQPSGGVFTLPCFGLASNVQQSREHPTLDPRENRANFEILGEQVCGRLWLGWVACAEGCIPKTSAYLVSQVLY